VNFDFTIEESWIFELWDFLMAVTSRRKAKNQTIKGHSAQLRHRVVGREA
jgi:hypothetical protein